MNAGVNSPYWLIRPWQQSRTIIPEVSHVVRSAIMEKYVPGAIKADCRKEDKNDSGCVDEKRHHCISIKMFVSTTGAQSKTYEKHARYSIDISIDIYM